MQAPLIRPAFATAIPETAEHAPTTTVLPASAPESRTETGVVSSNDEVTDPADSPTSVVDEPVDESYAPPVTAGTVRRRTDPDSTPDAERGTY